MKKTNKSAASPAPATPAKKAAATLPTVAAPAPASKTPLRPQPAVAKLDPVNPPAPASRLASKPASPAPSPATDAGSNLTAITAKIDVGFGNALFIRGEGPGLSWNKGLPLKNTSSDAWTVSFPKATRPIAFKLLVNDETWSQGPDFSADPGAAVTVYPSF